MKTTLTVASVVFALGYAVAIAVQSAGLVSFNIFGLPVLIGGASASALVALAFSDYSRRPSFRVRKPRNTSAAPEMPANHVVEDPSVMWTYTTRSV